MSRHASATLPSQSNNPMPAIVTKDQYSIQTSPSPSMASQLEFHHFRRLPEENRLAIWGFACKEPQIISVVYFDRIVGETYILGGDIGETEPSREMRRFRFRGQIPSVLHVNSESRKHALEYYPLFFSNAPNNQSNAYFNPNIDTCYIALADQSYEIKSMMLRYSGKRYVNPSNEQGRNQSWNLEHLGFVTERLTRPKDLPDFPAVKFMAVDEAFLRKSQEMEGWVAENWKSFLAWIPRLESFTFVHDGNTRLLSKGIHARNWEAEKIWGLSRPSVFISKFLSG
ncbi:uncharacterized protein PAC_01990 [Phialocephala subalpina]|uniref:2EXR domain-containing protein n=1 Tax=Phialocephala subalpina TaxID=576137 RepID=A0A1L7WH71_9HELO|nr:uncharacterized protein PAC_01990 [Phialocephala subalpina]